MNGSFFPSSADPLKQEFQNTNKICVSLRFSKQVYVQMLVVFCFFSYRVIYLGYAEVYEKKTLPDYFPSLYTLCF